MKPPWTLRLVALDTGAKIAYAGPQKRFWTRGAAAKEAARMNAKSGGNRSYRYMPALTPKEPW